jgi:hypothetical protein
MIFLVVCCVIVLQIAVLTWVFKQPKNENVSLGQVTVVECASVKLRDDFEMPPKHKLWKVQGKVI